MVYPSPVIETTYSKTEPVKVPESELITAIENFGVAKDSFILMHKYNEVCVGVVKKGKIIFLNENPLRIEDIIEARIFNPDSELYIWRNGDSFQGRIITDNLDYQSEATEREYYQIRHLVFGQAKQMDRGNWIVSIEENQGFYIPLPLTFTKSQLASKSNRIFYIVRNYFDYDSSGLLQFHDARLVAFVDEYGEKMEVSF
jgi:CRISPR-associated protein (TIGR03984 family)